MAPGLRSRFGCPSSRAPMPGANELSTVEWQSAQVIPDPGQRVGAVGGGGDRPLDPHDSVELQERDRGRRAGEVDAPILDPLDDGSRKRGGVDLEADRKGGRRIDGGGDDGLHLQRVGPLRLVAERLDSGRSAAPPQPAPDPWSDRRRWSHKRRRRPSRESTPDTEQVECNESSWSGPLRRCFNVCTWSDGAAARVVTENIPCNQPADGASAAGAGRSPTSLVWSSSSR